MSKLIRRSSIILPTPSRPTPVTVPGEQKRVCSRQKYKPLPGEPQTVRGDQATSPTRCPAGGAGFSHIPPLAAHRQRPIAAGFIAVYAPPASKTMPGSSLTNWAGCQVVSGAPADMMGRMSRSIARCIDHSVLSATATAADVRAGCELATELQTATVCVKPCHVTLATRLLDGSHAAVATVIGFPHGGSVTSVKSIEASEACGEGARELDMAVNLGAVFAGDWQAVESDIAAVVAAAHPYRVAVKVIFECGLLPDDATKIELCRVAVDAGAAFLKTSTGFGLLGLPDGSFRTSGATEHDVKLLRQYAPSQVGVKASGGIRTLAQAARFLGLGANRLGTSSTRAIVEEETTGPAHSNPT